MPVIINLPRTDTIPEDRVPLAQELAFLARQTGLDELTLISRALRLGLELLYRRTVEQGLIDGILTPSEATATLGQERVDEIEYARQALAQDVARGLSL